MSHRFDHPRNSAFTLLELLIVMGVIGVLGAVTVAILNPAEYVRRARDTERMAELEGLSKALDLAELNRLSLGSTSIVYVSIPDTSAICANLGLPLLPSGWSYACVTDANHRKVDGAGWVPVNFAQLPGGSPLSHLPTDPVNTTSSGNYYTYVTGGSYELTAALEATKNRSQEEAGGRNGGDHNFTYEAGSDLKLTPGSVQSRAEDASLKNGLVGWWTFDEESGTTSTDMSGNNRTGELNNGPTWQSGGSCKTGRCLSFDGADDQVLVPNGVAPEFFGDVPFTVAAWVYPRIEPGTTYVIMQLGGNYGLVNDITAHLQFYFGVNANSFVPLTVNAWSHVAGVRTGAGNNWRIYLNGSLITSGSTARGEVAAGLPLIFARASNGSQQLNGLIDEARIYNRALSADEIKTLYDAAK